MAANRLIYLTSLMLAVVFYLIHGAWFSLYLLCFAAALPVFSLLCSLPAMRKLQAEAYLPSHTELGCPLELRLRVKTASRLPLPEFRVRLRVAQQGDKGKDVRVLSYISRTDRILPLQPKRCGIFTAILFHGRVYDWLGLFSLGVKLPSQVKTAVLAPAIQPEPMPQAETLEQLLQAKPGGGFSEIHDHREYRPGDNARQIHWKLSCKTDKLIVREAMIPTEQRYVVAAEPPKNQEEFESVLGQLRWMCQWLTEQGRRHTVCWMQDGGLCLAEAGTEEDDYKALERLCAMDIGTGAALPAHRLPQADWFYLVRPAKGEGAK